MNKGALLALLTTSTALLSACGPIYNTTYTYRPPRNQHARRCIVACQRNKLMCQRNADKSYQHCEDRAGRDAKRAYHDYKVKQRRQHKPIKLGPEDFRQDWSCSHYNNCDAGYRQCYTTCGGTVITHKVCVAFCGKKVSHNA